LYYREVEFEVNRHSKKVQQKDIKYYIAL
jgi:hypothetical protein